MNEKINSTFIILLFIATFFSFLFHEFGHWIIGEILGNNMIMTLNSAYPKGGKFINEWNSVYVFIGGPLFTVLQAMFAFYLIMKYKKVSLYPFLFFPFLMRLFSLTFAFKLEDEAIVSSLLQIGTFTFPVIIVLILSILIWRGSIYLNLNIRFNSYCALFCSIFLIILVNINKVLF